MGKKKGKTQDEKGDEGDERATLNEDMDTSAVQKGKKKPTVQEEEEDVDKASGGGKKGKKGKKKDDDWEDEDDVDKEAEKPPKPAEVSKDTEKASGGGKKGKKGKKKDDDWEDEDDVDKEAEKPPKPAEVSKDTEKASGGGKKGKKGKKKDDDWEDEDDVDKEAEIPPKPAEVSKDTEKASGGGKKGKKGKKKDDDWEDEDDVDKEAEKPPKPAEVEKASGGGKKGKKGKKKDDDWEDEDDVDKEAEKPPKPAEVSKDTEKASGGGKKGKKGKKKDDDWEDEDDVDKEAEKPPKPAEVSKDTEKASGGGKKGKKGKKNDDDDDWEDVAEKMKELDLNEKPGDGRGKEKASGGGKKGKKGKKKDDDWEDEDDVDKEAEKPPKPAEVSKDTEKASGGGKKGKKGKKKDDDWEDEDDVDMEAEKPPKPAEVSKDTEKASGGGKKGKKGKKKDDDDDDWEDLGKKEEAVEIAQPQEVAERNTEKASGGGKKGKKGKKKDDDWEDEDDVDKEAEKPPKPAEVSKDTEKASGGGKKGKKGKKKDDDWEDEDDVDKEAEKPPKPAEVSKDTEKASGGAKKGKKGKKKDDDWEDEDDVDKEAEKPPKPAEVSKDTEKASGGGKKGKKGKKKDDDWANDLAEEIEGLKISKATGGSEDQDQRVTTAIADTTSAAPEAKGMKDTEPPLQATQADKKAAKKERQKEKAKQLSGETPPTSVVDVTQAQPLATPTQAQPLTTPTQAQPDSHNKGEEPGPEEDGEEEEDDKDDKKKKKKKKKKEKGAEEGKGAKKPAKTAILKMKEQLEALRLEQKKREEEELERIRKEEEAERLRLEKIQLEKERKERKKQKDKEKKERLKREGKPVTKAEREKRAKQLIQLEAMKALGVNIPTLTKEQHDEAEEKKKVKYGSRVRSKKKGPPQQDQPAASTREVAMDTQLQGDNKEEKQPLPSETTLLEDVASDSENEHSSDDEDDNKVVDNWEELTSEEEEKAPPAVMEVEGVKQDASPPKAQEGVEPSPAQRQEPDAPLTSQQSKSTETESESESSSEDSDEEDESLTDQQRAYNKASRRIQSRRQQHKEERSPDILRSPVICVLGHVDTGKTKILDKIRHTHVQDGEAGGITQQIGATFVPKETVKEQTKMIKEFVKMDTAIPGLLIIDTPGHEAFSNLRVRGSSMCDLAILVVDIMHGLEGQTIESLNILKKGNAPFVVALNKIDRLYDWFRNPHSSVKDTLKKQKPNTLDEFQERLKSVIGQLSEQSVNAALYWDKVDFGKDYVPIVPVSAITGDGMGDLIAQVASFSQKYLAEKLMLSQELEAVVLEVKVISGLGHTIDIILRDGFLHEGDTLVLTSGDGPFTTTARSLLMPQPLKELRVKNAYVNHKTVAAAQGVKICAKDLDRVLAGTPVFVAKKPDEVPVLMDEANRIMKGALSAIQISDRGVYVQSSTLGSLEALLTFLKQSKIPYSAVNLGPLHKKDVMKASVMLEHDPQWAVILAFDVKVEKEAQEYADTVGVKIFTADIIYHLFDKFMKYRQDLIDQKRKQFESIAVFPCKLRILPNCIFNTRDPIVVGVVVEAGIVKPGTPLTLPSKDFLDVGVVSSLEVNHKQVENARKGTEVCIKIESVSGDAPRLYGRHFDHTDLLVSKISRESIDAVKDYFRDDLQKSDWQLMVELKKTFQII